MTENETLEKNIIENNLTVTTDSNSPTISKVKLQNGTIYNLRDDYARKCLKELLG